MTETLAKHAMLLVFLEGERIVLDCIETEVQTLDSLRVAAPEAVEGHLDLVMPYRAQIKERLAALVDELYTSVPEHSEAGDH